MVQIYFFLKQLSTANTNLIMLRQLSNQSLSMTYIIYIPVLIITDFGFILHEGSGAT